MNLNDLCKNGKWILASFILSSSACITNPNQPTKFPRSYDWLSQEAEKQKIKGNKIEYEKLITKIRDTCLEKGWYERAGDMEEILGNIASAAKYYERAYKIYKENRAEYRTNELASKLGFFANEKGKFDLAIKYYSLSNQPYAIAETAEKKGDLKLAFENYLLVDKREKIKEIGESLAYQAETNKDYKSALNYFTLAANSKKQKQNRLYLKAAKCAEKLFLMYRARELYNQYVPDYLDNFPEALPEFKEKTKSAISILVERGDFKQAIKISDIISKEYQEKLQTNLHYLRNNNNNNNNRD